VVDAELLGDLGEGEHPVGAEPVVAAGDPVVLAELEDDPGVERLSGAANYRV
jgi:hypothetical protein